MDVLRQTSPVADFPGFVQNAEFAGLSVEDIEILTCLYDNARNDFFLLISCQDEDFTLDSCESLASAVG